MFLLQVITAFPQSAQPPYSGLSFLDAVFLILAWLIGVVVVSMLVWILLRRWLNQQHRLPPELRMQLIQVLVPRAGKQELDKEASLQVVQEKIAVAEGLYAVLGGLKAQVGLKARLFGRFDHLSFEVVARRGQIYFYVAVPQYMRHLLEEQIHAQYPDAQLIQVPDYNLFHPTGTSLATALMLERISAFPIKTYKEMESDPLNGMTHALSKIGEHDTAAIQFVIRSAHRSWRVRGIAIAQQMQQGKKMSDVLDQSWTSKILFAPFRLLQYVFQSSTKPTTPEPQKKYELSPRESEMIKHLENKAAKAGLDVNIRIVVSSAIKENAQRHMHDILHAFSQYSIYQYGNRFRSKRAWSTSRIMEDYIYRSFNTRYRIVLNTEEMTSLYHFPLASTDTPNIVWLGARKASPPVDMPRTGLTLGYAEYRGTKQEVNIDRDDRRRHVYIVGRSGSGKSALMENMVIQDIINGEGVAVVDPHGDLIEHILPHVPPARMKDVIVFDPGDIEAPIGLNMLEAHTPEEMDFVAQEMVQIFYKLVPNPDMIGPMFEHNMRNVMLTLMANKEHPGTMADIPRMFTDPAFQKYNLQFVTDPVVRSFWEKEMAQTSDFHKSEMLGYLISKVGRFVENEMVRNIIGQPTSGFNIREIMDSQKILLVNLSKGKMGEVNSNLLGLIVVAKLQMAALARANQPEDQRKDFYLYIDEFQNFITDSIAIILSEARKYRLCLTMAHQYMAQLVKGSDTSTRDAVLGNAGTMIAFRIGVEDAEVLEKEFLPVFNQNDLVNIERYTAYIKLLINSTASRPFNMHTYPPYSGGDLVTAAQIREYSRVTYGRPRAEVAAEIMERTQLGSAQTKTSVGIEASM